MLTISHQGQSSESTTISSTSSKYLNSAKENEKAGVTAESHAGHPDNTLRIIPNEISGTWDDPTRFRPIAKNSSLADPLSPNLQNISTEAMAIPTRGYRTEEEIKVYQQMALNHISGTNKDTDLCEPNNFYDSKAIEIYTYSSPKSHPCICFVVKPQSELKEYPIKRTHFYAQLQQFVLLRNKLKQSAAYFIAENPDSETRGQYIFGAFFGQDLFIIDPRGGQPNTALTEALLNAKRDFVLENIYLSKTVMAATDSVGKAISGPVCVEFMKRCKSLPFRMIKESFIAMKAVSTAEMKVESSTELSDSPFLMVDVTKNKLMASFLMYFVDAIDLEGYAANSKSLRLMQKNVLDTLDKAHFGDMTEQAIMHRLFMSDNLATKLDEDLQFLQLREMLKTPGCRMISSMHLETSSPEVSPSPQGNRFSTSHTPKGLTASNSISSLDTSDTDSMSNLLRSMSFASVDSEESDLLTRSSGGVRLHHIQSNAELLRSPTMVQDDWSTHYFPSVARLITSPTPCNEMIKTFLGPKTFLVVQRYKQATQEKEVKDQQLQDEYAFIGRLYKTVCQFEERMHNAEILRQYEKKVINADEIKVSKYNQLIFTNETFTAIQQEELNQCRIRIAEYGMVLAQHQRASVEHSSGIASHYHKIMNEDFKENKDSKQEGDHLSFQAQIAVYKARVAYRTSSLTIDPNYVTKLHMQLQYDVAKDSFFSDLLVTYGIKLEIKIQRLLRERTSELHIDVLRQYKREYPLEFHEDFLNQLSEDFFQNRNGNSSLKTFIKSGNLTKFKNALHEKFTKLKMQIDKADTEQANIDFQYSQSLAAAINDYRQVTEVKMKDKITSDEILGYIGGTSQDRSRWTSEDLCRDVMSTGIPFYPLRRNKEADTENGLLHVVAKAYVQASPLAKKELLKIFEELLQRGCDLLAENKAKQTPFAYANSFLPIPIDDNKKLPDWDLLKIAVKNNITLSEAQKQVRDVILDCFNNHESFFRKCLSFCNERIILQEKRREQVTMLLYAVITAAKKMNDEPIQNTITEIAAMPQSQGGFLASLLKVKSALGALTASPRVENRGVYANTINNTIREAKIQTSMSVTSQTPTIFSPVESKEILTAPDKVAATAVAMLIQSELNGVKTNAELEEQLAAEKLRRMNAEMIVQEKEAELARLKAKEKKQEEKRKAARAKKLAKIGTACSVVETSTSNSKSNAETKESFIPEPVLNTPTNNKLIRSGSSSSSLTHVTASLSSFRANPDVTLQTTPLLNETSSEGTNQKSFVNGLFVQDPSPESPPSDNDVMQTITGPSLNL